MCAYVLVAANRMAETTFSGLFPGLAGVALLVGGVGVANTMVISVLERQREIGLRRALGATRGQVRTQFFTESVVLCLLGGLTGAALGVLAVGVLAGLYPAIRAARLVPAEALTAP